MAHEPPSLQVKESKFANAGIWKDVPGFIALVIPFSFF
jgi:hypothetical protein